MKNKLIAPILFSLLVALITFLAIEVYQLRVLQEAIVSDIGLPIEGAYILVHGGDPYTPQLDMSYNEKPMATYPLTTLIALVPFSFLGPVVGGGLFFACSIGLLAFTLLIKNPQWRFLLFASASFLQTFLTLQFSPLIATVLLLPALAPLALVKPQIGLPILLHKPTKWIIISVFIFLAITFIIIPDWPFRWLRTAQNYDGFIPILTLPFGPLLLLSLLNWKDDRARLLFFFALFPQRGLYDLLPLFFIPSSKKSLIVLCGLSWLCMIFSRSLYYSDIEAKLIVPLIYVPLLWIVGGKEIIHWGSVLRSKILPTNP